MEKVTFKFKMGKVILKGNPLAEWIVVAGMILNDLIFANRNLLEVHKNNGPAAEALYYFRIAASHFREACRFFDASYDVPKINNLIKKLSQEAKKNYNLMRSKFSPWPGSFVEKKIKPIRDHSFHYPNPGDKDLQKALEDTSDFDTRITFEGDSWNGFRAEFADEIANNYALGHLADLEDHKVTMDELSQIMVAAIRFLDEAITIFFEPLVSSGLVTEGSQLATPAASR